MKELTCYKNPKKPSYIDPILTNKLFSFQNSCVIETIRSDFHRMRLTATKMNFQKHRPRNVNKNFNNENYRKDLLTVISNSCLRFDYSVSVKFLFYVE